MTRSNPRIDLYQHQPCHFLDFLLLLVWPHTECWLNLNMPLHGVSHSCNGWLVTCGLPYSICTFLRFVSSLSLPFFLNGKTEAFRAWESCMQQLAYLWYASLSFSLTGEPSRSPTLLAGLCCGAALWDGAAGKGSSGQLIVVSPTSPSSYLASALTSMY